MASGMDVFQTVVKSLEIIYRFGNPFFSHAKDAEGLFMRLQWDLRILQRIQASVKDLKQSQAALPETERVIWDSSLEYLRRLFLRLLSLQQDIQSTQTKTVYPFREQDYRELCRELFEWTQRFDVRLMGLSPAMRAQFRLDLDSPDANQATPYLASQERIEAFRQQGETARATSADRLLVSNIEEAFGVSRLPPRHSFAKFYGQDAIVEYKNIPVSVIG